MKEKKESMRLKTLKEALGYQEPIGIRTDFGIGQIINNHGGVLR